MVAIVLTVEVKVPRERETERGSRPRAGQDGERLVVGVCERHELAHRALPLPIELHQPNVEHLLGQWLVQCQRTIARKVVLDMKQVGHERLHLGVVLVLLSLRPRECERAQCREALGG